MLGYGLIPGQWKSGIPAIADQKFKYTDFTFHTIVNSTQQRAVALVKANERSEMAQLEGTVEGSDRTAARIAVVQGGHRERRRGVGAVRRHGRDRERSLSAGGRRGW